MFFLLRWRTGAALVAGLVLNATIPNPGFAQAAHNQLYSTQTPRFAPGQGNKLAYAPPGGYLMATALTYGLDSATLYVLRTTAGLQPHRTAAWRLSRNFPICSTDALALTVDQFLIGGGLKTRTSLDDPFLLALDSTLTPQWAYSFPLSGSLSQFSAVVRTDTSVTAYAGLGVGGATSRFIRVTGSLPGGQHWQGQAVQVAFNRQIAVTSAVVVPGTQTQFVGGIAANSPATNYDGMLLRFDGTTVPWAVSFANGRPDERVVAVRLTAYGDVLTLMVGKNQSTTGHLNTLCRFGPGGNLQWSAGFARLNREMKLTDVHELPDGDLLLAGSTYYNKPIILRLSSDGTLIWAREWLSPGFTTALAPRPDGGAGLHVGGIWISELTRQGDNCNFVPVANTEIEFTRPVISPTLFTPTVTPFSLTATPIVLSPRQVGTSHSPGCTLLATPGEQPVAAFDVWPQPAHGSLNVTLPTGWNPATTHLHLYSLTGALLWEGVAPATTTLLPLRGPAGGCILMATNGRQRLRRIVVVE